MSDLVQSLRDAALDMQGRPRKAEKICHPLVIAHVDGLSDSKLERLRGVFSTQIYPLWQAPGFS